jgi:hypothetical protein
MGSAGIVLAATGFGDGRCTLMAVPSCGVRVSGPTNRSGLGSKHMRLLRCLAAALFVVTASHASAQNALLGASEAEHRALDFLKSLPREWSGTSARDCKTYDDKNIERLTPAFAGAAASFLKAFVEMHGNVTITSAHRTAQEQSCVCEGEKGPCAGKPRIVRIKKGRTAVRRGGTSRHQLGIALDVRAGTGSDEEFACLHEFAQLNPQFGVRFPLGKRDRPHLEPAPGRVANVKLAALGSMSRPATPCTTMTTMLVFAYLD